MHRHRHGLLAAFAVLVILAALVPPLGALLALHGRADGKRASGSSIGPAAAATLPQPARRPLASRVDDHGRVRRIYMPRLAFAGSPETRARDVLAALAPELGLPVQALDLRCRAVRRSPSGDHVRLQQYAGGAPVWGAEAVVSFDARTEAALVVASDLTAGPGSGIALPVVAGETAIAIALRQLGATGLHAPPEGELHCRERPSGWAFEYRVVVPCDAPAGDWEVWVDASTGGVREVRDRTVHAALPRTGGTGSGLVFAPDPCSSSGDPTLRDQSDADTAVPESAYTRVDLPNLALPVRGYYRLAGPWVALEDWESPAGAADSSATLDFSRSRSSAGFEDVMVYYYLDAMQRWYRALGFTDANARAQVADPHGAYGADNSKFMPSTHRIAYGEGGVDDAEDAEVILHEYGHATQFDLVPTWGTGGHTAAMGEGFGDYLANSYAWSLYPERVEEWNGVFQWDGHNEYWAGRPAIDPALHYPEDVTTGIYRGGTLWCSALSEALYALGDRAVMDRLVLDHHYALSGMATMEDAANAILASDVALYEGAHLPALVEVFGRWGMVDSSDWMPIAIEHVPLDIRTAAAAEVRLTAQIVASVAPVAADGAVACVRVPGAPWARLPLELRDGSYSVGFRLPAGSAADIEYYLEARDALGNAAQLPARGAAAPFRVGVGMVAESFETAGLWTTASTDDATAGRWTRVVPVGTIAQPDADRTHTGVYCFLTGNGTAGAPASDADVDGGETTLLSPVWDLRGCTQVRLGYWRWFSNDRGAAPGEDPWCVDVSNDGGTTWVELERSLQSDARWRQMEFDLAAILGQPEQVRVRFVAADRGAASLVEAAVDDLLLQASPGATSVSAGGALSTSGPRLVARPNPARIATEFQFALAAPAPVQLAIFDCRGRRLRTLVDRELGAGRHSLAWDARDGSGRPLPAGVYLVRLVDRDGPTLLKLALLR